MAMEPKLVGFIAFDTGAGTVTAQRAYNATVARTADGDYNVTIGQAGVDEDLCEISASATSGAAVGVGTARIINVIHTSDTVKRVLVRDDVGALALATVNIAFRRLPPLPTP